VEVIHDPELEKDFPRCWPHLVTVHMQDGRTHALLSEYPPGRVAPIPQAAVDAKFLSQSARYLGDAGAGKALELLRDVDRVKNMREIAGALACR
jgi:2-methylcitrate dehydratase PrpD